MESWFMQLTRTGGQEVMVNMAQVVSVKDRAGDKYVVVTTANGVDFEVQEEYADIVDALMGSGPS
jgi:hypothetical protein